MENAAVPSSLRARAHDETAADIATVTPSGGGLSKIMEGLQIGGPYLPVS